MPYSPSGTWPKSRAFALLLAMALGLGGCAQLPSLDTKARLKPVQEYQTQNSFDTPSATWPEERWWLAYGDETLNRLIAEALENAPDLRVAEARLRRAEAGTRIVDSANSPQLSANASAEETKQTYNLLVPRNQLPQGWNDYGRVTLDFRWDLDFWGQNRSALAAATSELEAGRAELAQARLMLVSGVAANYAELSRLYANRETSLKAVAIRQKTARLFAERQANGLETRGSLREADARRAMAEGQLLAIEEQISLQRNRLAALLGAGPDRGLEIPAPTLKMDHPFGLPAELKAELLGRRPDIIAARLRAEAAEKRIDSAKAEFYPNVNLAGFFGYHSLGLDHLFKSGSDTGSIAPAISLPIFNGGRLKAQYAGSLAGFEEAVAGYNATVSHALQEVADNAVSQKALAQQLAKAEEAVEAATEAHRVASKRYEGGLANYLEVLSAEDGLLASLNARTNLRANAFTLDIALKRALGGGFHSDQR